MPFDPNIHHRRSIRLRGYDYGQPGAYFVTICAQGRRPQFGTIRGRQLVAHDSGLMAARWWAKLPEKFPAVIIDAFVVMPDHMHGIVIIAAGDAFDAGAHMGDAFDAGAHMGDDFDDRDDFIDVRANPRVRPHCDSDAGNAGDAGDGRDDRALGAIVQWFKTMTTNEYIRSVKQLGWPAFDRRLWQRNYYERIIRTDAELQRVRAYIANNPARWPG